MTRAAEDGRPRAAPPGTRWRIGDVHVDPVDLAGAVDAIEGLVRRGEGGCVFTPNAHHLVLAREDPAFRAAYAAADLSLADGMPLVWSSRLLGGPLPGKVSGSDLVKPLLERAAARGWRVYLLGGAPGVAELAARRVEVALPGVDIVGTDGPEIRANAPDPEGDRAAARVAAAAPHLLLVALGAPKQELWIHRNLHHLRPAVAVGVGASLDFLAGRARRAPPWVSASGLEWLWRLGHEPRRLWRRYLVESPRFALIVLDELRRARTGGDDPCGG